MIIKAIILDIDNTLYDYDFCHDSSLKFVHKNFTKLFPHFKKDFFSCYKASAQLVKKRIPTHGSSHHRLLYFQNFLEQEGLVTYPHAYNLYRTYWEYFWTQMKLFNGVTDFLNWIKSQGLSVTLLTDLIAETQHQKISHLKISHFVDYLVTSEEVGIEKPDKRMFSLACEKSKASPEEAIMIGDSWEKDILGAQNFGMRSIFFNPNSKPFDKKEGTSNQIFEAKDFYTIKAMIESILMREKNK